MVGKAWEEASTNSTNLFLVCPDSVSCVSCVHSVVLRDMEPALVLAAISGLSNEGKKEVEGRLMGGIRGRESGQCIRFSCFCFAPFCCHFFPCSREACSTRLIKFLIFLSLAQIYACCVHVFTCYQSFGQTFCLW